MDKADCFALKTLAREQEFAKAIQIFLYKSSQGFSYFFKGKKVNESLREIKKNIGGMLKYGGNSFVDSKNMITFAIDFEIRK